MLAYFLKMHSEFLVPQQFEVQESSIQIPFSLLLIKCSNSCFFSAEEWHNLSHAGCLNGLSKYISIAKKSVFQFISSPSSLLLKFTQESQSGLGPTFQCWICLSKLTYLTGRSCCASLDLFPSTQSIDQVTLEGDTRWEKLWMSADPAFCWSSGHCIPLCLIVTSMFLPWVFSSLFTCSTLRLMPAGAKFSCEYGHVLVWNSSSLSVHLIKIGACCICRQCLGSWSSPACRLPPKLDFTHSLALVHRDVSTLADEL